MEAFLRNQILNVCRLRNPRIQHEEDEKKRVKLPHRAERVHVEGDLLT